MAERTFQFGGEKKFSSILKVAGDWISSYQSADIFFPLSLSISTKQSICHHSQYATKAGMNLITCSCEN